MYVFEGKQAKVELRSQREIDGIIEKLAEIGLSPTLRQASHALLSAIGIDAKLWSRACSDMLMSMMSDHKLRFSPRASRTTYGEESIVGDIYCHDDSLLIVQPDGAKLIACEIRPHNVASGLEAFTEKICEAAKASLDGRRLRGMNFDWTSVPVEYFHDLRRSHLAAAGREPKLAMKPATLVSHEIENSRLLIEPKYRSFLQRLVQAGKVRAVDAMLDTDLGTTDPLIEKGLLRKEFLVRCRMDSRTLCTVESQEDLEYEFGERLRCSSCGRTFKEELIQEVYAPTAHAKALINGSHWMTVWITDVLMKAGVDKSSIHWSATAGEDEIDIIAEVQGHRMFFELKDREFGLGDAYPFVTRMQRYGADGGVIVSTERVADEVKGFIAELPLTPVRIIEGTRKWARCCRR